MCAHAVRVALLKVSGVESVDVSLERAMADIRLRSGNSVSLARIREIVKNNGFTAKEASVAVVGTLVERGGKPALEVAGTNTVMLLAPDPKQRDTYKALQDGLRDSVRPSLELSGVVDTRPDEPDTLTVKSARVAGR